MEDFGDAHLIVVRPSSTLISKRNKINIEFWPNLLSQFWILAAPFTWWHHWTWKRISFREYLPTWILFLFCLFWYLQISFTFSEHFFILEVSFFASQKWVPLINFIHYWHKYDYFWHATKTFSCCLEFTDEYFYNDSSYGSTHTL